MTKREALQLFEEKKVRTVWDDEQEKWYFSIVDVCGVLTDSKDALTARKYWNKLKQRLKEEGNETVTNCHQLKLQAADGKMRLNAFQRVGTNCHPPFRSAPRWTAKNELYLEIALNILAEASTTELSKQRNPKGYKQQTKVAKEGGSVAKAACNQLESKLGRSIISDSKASDYLLPNNEDETTC